MSCDVMYNEDAEGAPWPAGTAYIISTPPRQGHLGLAILGTVDSILGLTLTCLQEVDESELSMMSLFSPPSLLCL